LTDLHADLEAEVAAIKAERQAVQEKKQLLIDNGNAQVAEMDAQRQKVVDEMSADLRDLIMQEERLTGAEVRLSALFRRHHPDPSAETPSRTAARKPRALKAVK
jgi:hypothetical protein